MLMKRFTQSMFVVLMGLFGFCLSAAADTVFDFNASGHAVSSSDSHDGDITEPYVLTQDGVTLTVSPKDPSNNNENRFWGTNNGPQLRCYSGTITIESATTMKSIVFDATSNFNLTPDNGTLTSTTWNGESKKVIFTVNKNTQMNKITVSADAAEVPSLPEVSGIGEFLKLTSGTEAKMNFTDNVQVVFAHHNTEKGRDYVVLQDDSKNRIVLYNMGAADVVKANDVLTGSLTGKFSPYYGMNEMAKSGSTDLTTITATEGTAIKVDVLGGVAKAFDPFKILKLCQIKGVTLATEDNRTYAVEGQDRIEVRDNFAVGYELPELQEGQTLTITGIIVPYVKNNDTIYQITPISQEALVVSNAQFYKSFAETTVFIPTEEAVAAGVAEGWMEHGGQFTNNKTLTINPNTDEEETQKNAPGIGVKKGNSAKSFKTYVTGLQALWTYATSTNSSDKTFVVTATDNEGNVTTLTGTSSGSQTVVIKLELDPAKQYVVDYAGTKADDNEAGDDMVLHALKFFPGGASQEEILDLTIDHKRAIGMGYGATEIEVDLAAAKSFLGVEELTTSMLRIENPDGELISDYAPFDGWFNTKGVAETWSSLNAQANAADKAGICVKFFQAIPDGVFTICDMNGADVAGNTYTVKWRLVNGEKSVRYAINVNFVKPDAIALDIVDKGIKTSVSYDAAEGEYTMKEAAITDADVATICQELGISNLSEATVYGYNPTTKELVKNYSPYDGWRDANGDFHNWNADGTQAPACVKIIDGETTDNGKTYYCYNRAGQAPQTIKCFWALANDKKVVLVEIDFTYTDLAGIEGLAADQTSKVVYNLQGQRVEKVVKGIYVINGKKVLVK